jgi:hypothetical protein
LKPSKPLVGTVNSKFTIPLSSTILVIIPFLFPSSAIIVHSTQAGTEIFTFSIGSIFLPFSSCIITTGAPTCNSKPSLLIVSISTDKCNSHLPATSKLSPLSKSIFNHTFVSNSFSNLSLICLEVINSHSLPQKGELFTKNSIFRVGSSIVIAGIGSKSSTEEIVSQTNISVIPAIVTISPAKASFVSTFSKPSFVRILVILPFLLAQSFDIICTS